jgi:outer membrane receptor protein involved in Fe transport
MVLTHSTSDPIDPNQDGRNEQGAIDRDTLDARLAFKLAENSRLTVGMYHFDEDQWRGPGSVERFQAGGDTYQRWAEEDIPIYHRVVSGTWGHEFDNGAIMEVRASRSERHQEIWEYWPEDKDGSYGLLFDVHSEYDYATILGGGLVGSRWLLEGGMEYQKEDVWVNNVAELDPTQRIVNDIVEGAAPFVQGTVALPARVDLVLGLRYDDWREFGDAWSPRIGVRWKPLEDLYINAEVGGSYRPPWSVFAEVCCGNRYQSNKEVRPETGRAAHLALAWYPTQRLKVTFAAQHAEFDDLIIHGVTGGAGFNAVYRNLNVPDSHVTGAEVGFNMRFDRLTFGGSYGLVDSDFTGDIMTQDKDPFTGEFEDRVVLPDGQGRLPYIKDDNASLFVSWAGPKFDGRINADYFGHDWIQRLADFDEPGFPDAAPGTDVLPLLYPTPSYWSLNMEGGWTYNRWRFFAGIDNLLDEYQDDLADATTSAKWGMQRGRFFYGGFSFDL